MSLVTKSILKRVYKKREPWSHKYDFGHLLVIGGSKIYSGSPALVAMAALRTGVDLVTVMAPRRAADIAATFSPDIVTYPLDGDYIYEKHHKDLIKFTKGKTAVTIGNGLWRIKPVMDMVAHYLNDIDVPCVVDADAIRALGKGKNIDLSNCVLTPHDNEFLSLHDEELTKEVKERKRIVKEVAGKYNTTILLKGHIDVISDGERLATNRTGNPYLTVGGTGDTLTGVCGSLIAQGVDNFTAACASAYINGRAGTIASRDLKQSLTASDLIDALPKAIKG